MYLVFKCQDYEARGGLDDLVGIFHDIADLPKNIEQAFKIRYGQGDWIEIAECDGAILKLICRIIIETKLVRTWENMVYSMPDSDWGERTETSLDSWLQELQKQDQDKITCK